MANNDPPPLDPFTTAIRADLSPTEDVAARKALEEARVKAQQEREKFCLKKQTTTKLSEYHQRKWQKRLADEMPARALNFDTQRQI
jgi:hypothetical protein